MMVPVKFFVVLFVVAALIGSQLGVEALKCKCTSVVPNCTSGVVECEAAQTFCTTITMKVPAIGGSSEQNVVHKHCAGGGQNATAGCSSGKQKGTGWDEETCLCNDKDECNADKDKDKGGSGSSAEILHSYSWSFLFFLVSCVNVVPTFVGGQ